MHQLSIVMAALQMSSRFISPTPAAVLTANASVRPPSMLSFAPPGCLQCRFPDLTVTTTMRRGQTAVFGRRPYVVARAQKSRGGGGGVQPAGKPSADRHFAKEREHVMNRYNEIVHIDHGCLYMEATSMSGQVCLSANQALKMASQVMDNASLSLGAPNEISEYTVYRTLGPYVKIFLDAAEASYKRTFRKDNMMSFLGALKGLASISHILLDTTLEALSHTHPRASLSEYAFNRDVKDMRNEFNQLMNGFEDEIGKTSSAEIGKLAIPRISEAIDISKSFVGLVVARRKRALEKTRSNNVAV